MVPPCVCPVSPPLCFCVPASGRWFHPPACARQQPRGCSAPLARAPPGRHPAGCWRGVAWWGVSCGGGCRSAAARGLVAASWGQARRGSGSHVSLHTRDSPARAAWAAFCLRALLTPTALERFPGAGQPAGRPRGRAGSCRAALPSPAESRAPWPARSRSTTSWDGCSPQCSTALCCAAAAAAPSPLNCPWLGSLTIHTHSRANPTPLASLRRILAR